MLYIIATTVSNPRYFMYDDSTRTAGRYYCSTPTTAILDYLAGNITTTHVVLPNWPKLREYQTIYATSESHPELFI